MAILFDLDGVLVNTHDVHRTVWEEWARSRRLDPAVVVAATFGRRPTDTVHDVAPHLDPMVELEHLDALLDRHVDEVTLHRGARSAIEVVGAGNWAVVTSTSKQRARRYLMRLDCALPDVVVGGEDVTHGKPAPDGYLAAAAALGIAPVRCLVVEDAPAGIAAGKAAGMMVLALATTRPAEELQDADVVVADLAAATDLLENWVDESNRRRG